MKRCRFCGQKILDDASQCEHCGKTLRDTSTESAEKSGLTNLDSWEKQSVPAWVMYAVVAFFLFVLAFLIFKGCQPSAIDKDAAMQIWRLLDQA
jgi:uncharacterized membrane protein YvbJ